MSEAWKRNLAVPFFTQRDNTYIWQQVATEDEIDSATGKKTKEKGKPFGLKYPMAYRSCNITSLCMLLHYWGITEDTPNQMQYYDGGNGYAPDLAPNVQLNKNYVF